MKLRTILSATALSAFALGAFAQTGTAKIDARQAKQEARIDQGVASGELTKHEAQKLDAQQKHIARAEGHAKADGVVTPGEKAHIAHLQKKASHDIKQQKHDGQTAG